MDCLTAPLDEMSPRGIMSSEKASNSPGLYLLKERSLALTPRQGPEINSQACLWVSPRPLLKGRNLALARRQGPEINSQACLWVSPRPLLRGLGDTFVGRICAA
jgi:hypothetical protein